MYRKIVLVGCGKEKKESAKEQMVEFKAEDIYTSDYFKNKLKYAKSLMLLAISSFCLQNIIY
ncbi:MAG: hypothetical protein LBC92_02305 [Rickettsiales bacterium]|nr:hypothetical protein [Rickettsiales bacterium]